MPSRITSKRVGSGMTAHTKRRTHYDLTQPLTKEEAAEVRSFFANLRPYDPIGRARRLAERTLKAIANRLSDQRDFEPYTGMGWYSREIIKRCDWLDEARARNEHGRCEQLAYEVGILWREATLKAAWDQEIEVALRHTETREKVNAKNRKATPAERKVIVKGIMEERGCKAKEASMIAAKRFPEKGTKSTFYTGYFKKL